MHVLQLSDFYRPILGGLENHVEALSAELVRLGHEATVVTSAIAGLPEYEEMDGVRVHRLKGWSATLLGPFHNDPQRPFHPPAPDPLLSRRLKALIAAERPDVVHSHSWIRYSYYPLHRADAGPAHVAMLHDYDLPCAKKTFQYKARHDQQTQGACTGPALRKCVACCTEHYGRLKGPALATSLRASRPLHRRADAYVANSSAVAAAARTVLAPGTDVTVIPAVVPNDLEHQADDIERPPFLPPEDGYLLYVGAIGTHKGVDVLLDAHRRMRHRVPLVLIGAQTGVGTGRATAGTDAGERLDFDAPGVHAVNQRPHAEVMAAWRRCAIGVVPSTWQEPQGLTAVEAMAEARPVVASAVGGLKDLVVHEETGLLVPPRDPEALARALDDLLADPERRARMGKAGRQRARDYEARAVAPRLLELFSEVLDRRAA